MARPGSGSVLLSACSEVNEKTTVTASQVRIKSLLLLASTRTAYTEQWSIGLTIVFGCVVTCYVTIVSK